MSTCACLQIGGVVTPHDGGCHLKARDDSILWQSVLSTPFARYRYTKSTTMVRIDDDCHVTDAFVHVLKAFTCQLHARHMHIVCMSHVRHMLITCSSHGRHMTHRTTPLCQWLLRRCWMRASFPSLAWSQTEATKSSWYTRPIG